MKELSHLSRVFSPFTSCQRASVLKKGKPLAKPYLDLGGWSTMCTQWGRNLEGKTMHPTVKAKLKLHRETLVLIGSSSSILMSFAFMEFPILLTKTIWKGNWNHNEATSSHLPGVLAMLGLLLQSLRWQVVMCFNFPAESLLLQQLFLIMPGWILNHLNCLRGKSSCPSGGFLFDSVPDFSL